MFTYTYINYICIENRQRQYNEIFRTETETDRNEGGRNRDRETPRMTEKKTCCMLVAIETECQSE